MSYTRILAINQRKDSYEGRMVKAISRLYIIIYLYIYIKSSSLPKVAHYTFLKSTQNYLILWKMAGRIISKYMQVKKEKNSTILDKIQYSI